MPSQAPLQHCLSKPCCPSSPCPVSQKAVSIFDDFLSFPVSRGAGLPMACSCWAGAEEPCTPFSFTPGFMECTDPRGGCRGPAKSWGFLESSDTLTQYFIFPLPLAKKLCVFCMFAFRQNHFPLILGFSCCLLSSSPPTAPSHTRGSSCWSRLNLQHLPQKEEPSKNKPSRSASEHTGPKSLSLGKATLPVTRQQQWEKGLSNTCEQKGILRKKGQAGGTVTMCCLGSHLWDSQQLCVCSCDMQHTHSNPALIVFDRVTSVCQRSSLGTKPVPRAQRSASRVGSDQCQELLPGQVSPSASPAASSACWDGSCCTWVKTFGVWGEGSVFAQCCDNSSCILQWQEYMRATCPNGFAHNTLDTRDVRSNCRHWSFYIHWFEKTYPSLIVKKTQTCFLQS